MGENLQLLLQAYFHLPTPRPKLVFVGDGPARVELESTCDSKGYDATFMGHRSGEELARCYASADVFAFPSFTEVSRPYKSVSAPISTRQTFGQVVLEAMASGLVSSRHSGENPRLTSHSSSSA